MPLYRLVKLMLVAPVDFFSRRELYGDNLVASALFWRFL